MTTNGRWAKPSPQAHHSLGAGPVADSSSREAARKRADANTLLAQQADELSLVAVHLAHDRQIAGLTCSRCSWNAMYMSWPPDPRTAADEIKPLSGMCDHLTGHNKEFKIRPNAKVTTEYLAQLDPQLRRADYSAWRGRRRG